jgi:FtsH-binding integral membrane protein
MKIINIIKIYAGIISLITCIILGIINANNALYQLLCILGIVLSALYIVITNIKIK